MNIAHGQRLTHHLRMVVTGKNRTLDCLYSVVFIFRRGSGQNLRALNQQAVVDNRITAVIERYANCMMALACTARSYKSNYFHSITPFTSS